MAVCFAHSGTRALKADKEQGVAWPGVLQGGKWIATSKNPERKWGGDDRK